MNIKEVILQTNEITGLRKFYEITLGLNLKNADENSFTIETKNSDLTFIKNSYLKNPFYHFAFNIPENKLKDAKNWLMQRTELIKSGDEDEFNFESWNADSVYFHDPAGNIAELIARHNLNNSSSEEFSAESFLNISEIGLPVRDVGGSYSKLYSEFSTPEFSGDRKSFCVAGDDYGLFVIVPEKRIWFPNLEKAGIFPVTVKIKSDVEKELQFEDLPYKIISIVH